MGRRDPIERANDERVDTQGVATWEPRSIADRLSVAVYRLLVGGSRWLLIGLAALILLVIVVSTGIWLVAAEPVVGVLVGLSAVPAFLLAAYLWRWEVTPNEPLTLLVATFVLAILFASFAAVLNPVGRAAVSFLLRPLGLVTPAVVLGLLVNTVVFFLIVGPIEEAVKLLAVRLWAYRDARFDAVVDGAIYGAVAGLGFATIENALFITQPIGSAATTVDIIGESAPIAATRSIVGPGHVIYSAIAGYYLGLAKFNPDHAGPLVVKGLGIAAILHAVYNTSVTAIPLGVDALTPFSPTVATLGFIVGYNLLIGYYLYRLLAGYRRAYRATDAGQPDVDVPPEPTEFDPPSRAR